MPKPLDFKGFDEYTYKACASMPAEAGLRAGSQGTNNLLLVMPKKYEVPSRRTEKGFEAQITASAHGTE